MIASLAGARIPDMETPPVRSQTELQQLVSKVQELPEGQRETLRRWLLAMMRPQYAHLISRLPKRSSTLVLVSAAALYSAAFSPEVGDAGETRR